MCALTSSGLDDVSDIVTYILFFFFFFIYFCGGGGRAGEGYAGYFGGKLLPLKYPR